MLAKQLLNFVHYDFMQHAFYAGSLIAILAGVVGFFVVIRGISFAAHALSHIGFAGACGAVLLDVSPLVGQLWLTLLAAAAMAGFSEAEKRNDTIIGIVLAFSLGLGSLFLFLNQHYAVSANAILFGDLLGISAAALNMIAVLVVLCLLVMMVISRPLWFSSLSRELAAAKAVPTKFLNVIFFLLAGVAITLASQVVGILLVFTLLIGAPAIAIRWMRGFWSGILLSILLNVLVVWLSLLLTAISNWPLSFWVSALVFAMYLLSLMKRI